MLWRFREKLENKVFPSYIKERRWFASKSRKIREVRIMEDIPLGEGKSAARLLFLGVRYTDDSSETYLLPVSFASGASAKKILSENPGAVLSRLNVDGVKGIVYDGIFNAKLQREIFSMIVSRSSARGIYGKLSCYPGELLKKMRAKKFTLENSRILEAEQSNTSILYGDKFFLKIFRKLEKGMNPDLEMGRFLTEAADFENVPPFAGALEYSREGHENIVIGILQGSVKNQGDAWKYTLDVIARCYKRVLSKTSEIPFPTDLPHSIFDVGKYRLSPPIADILDGVYIEMVKLLGKRTGELHLALSGSFKEPSFTPEPFSVFYQRLIYQSLTGLSKRLFRALSKNIKSLPHEVIKDAKKILKSGEKINDNFKNILKKKITAAKIRIHGDYHLGQVLYTGKDFVIIDFEGEPARPLDERRLKRSPLTDVAGMIRSFHYAAYNILLNRSTFKTEHRVALEPWADFWAKYIGGVFLDSYLKTTSGAAFIPKEKEELEIMLKVFLLEKAVYELGYELNNRPEWAAIPIKAIRQIAGI